MKGSKCTLKFVRLSRNTTLYAQLRKEKVIMVFGGTVGDPKEFDELTTSRAQSVLNNVLAE